MVFQIFFENDDFEKYQPATKQNTIYQYGKKLYWHVGQDTY